MFLEGAGCRNHTPANPIEVRRIRIISFRTGALIAYRPDVMVIKRGNGAEKYGVECERARPTRAIPVFDQSVTDVISRAHRPNVVRCDRNNAREVSLLSAVLHD